MLRIFEKQQKTGMNEKNINIKGKKTKPEK